ncbi:uncharacterized protein FIBRA_02143 [Fibroporia radiculosa]|uniref:Uncharacterized protein n=1 Tax=Fibroporia radiculosa TaxID=599839 RepID=J4I8W4_9APHY|nr:uncharacterized protein FIBRA_02143 [Fibroporia radiculosa]CCM00116.1 predicted protein [Fibroporia radiculosa]
MQRRPPAAVPPLALPVSQRATRRQTALPRGGSPHTPPNSRSPLPLLASGANRNSSDSWNSSNYDGADDMEVEWSVEQTRLLSRTLDALPAHLLTPFNGPVPPSNLLDKIARGVSQAKGSVGWPHSLRATRAKIVELARMRAKEAASDGASDTIAEEDASDPDAQQQSTSSGPKRPLYRQSSMDFMQMAPPNLMDNDKITRLSRRLQSSDRTIPNPSYRSHPSISSRPSSPSFGMARRRGIFPSTPSSTTLNSSNSDSRNAHMRRSMSDMSNSSDSFILPVLDPRVQRVKRADSFAGSRVYGPGQSLKRAPSFGTIPKRSSGAMSQSGRDSEATSSDEEEKMRSMKAKKARVKAASPTPLPTSSPSVSPEKPKSRRKSHQETVNKSPRANKETSARRTTKPRTNLKRNPIILGGELPHPQPDRNPPTTRDSLRTDNFNLLHTSRIGDLLTARGPHALEVPMTPGTPSTPQVPRGKSLRRTGGAKLPSRTIARKISFGSMIAPAPEAYGEPGSGFGLGLDSAFQLQ